jgi:3'-5' exoribonuclease
VGHINTAIVWVQQKADEVTRQSGEPFPQTIIDLVQHLILSHHGNHEYGSPKRPMIPEAFMLHYLDNLDAKVEMATKAVESDQDDRSSFTTYHKGLDGRLFKGSKILPE